jgi:hypothetical protein
MLNSFDRWDACERRLLKEIQEKLTPQGGFERGVKYTVWPQPFIKQKPNLKNIDPDEPPSLFDDVLQYIQIIYKRSFEGMPLTSVGRRACYHPGFLQWLQ